MGLRVDLINDGEDIDAEEVLDGSIVADEPASPPVAVPADDTPLDQTVADEADEFGDLDLGDGMSIQTAEDIETVAPPEEESTK